MSSVVPNENPLSYVGKEPVKRDFIRHRNPTPNDRGFAIGDNWINTKNNTSYKLTGRNSDGEVWQPLGTLPFSEELNVTQTTGAVTDTIASFNLENIANSWELRCRVVGFEASGSSAKAEEIIGLFKTDGVTASQVGTTVVAFNSFDSAISSSDVSFALSGNSVLINILGVAGLTINWKSILTANLAAV